MPDSTVTFFANREAWLEARKGSLGASDVARVFTDKVSEFALWAEKTGKIESKFPPLLSDFGLALEPVSREWTRRSLKNMVEDHLCFWSVINEDKIRMFRRDDRLLHASPDTLYGLLVGPPTRRVAETWLCQHKTIDRTQSWKVETGPEQYAWTQVQAELLCVPVIARAWVSYLIGNGYDADRDFKVYEVTPDTEFQARILAFAERFRHHVETDTPPEPGYLDDIHAVLATMFPPRKPRREGLLPAEHGPDVERWRQLDRALDELEREKQGIRNRLEYALAQADLEEATVAIAEGGPTTQPARLLRTARKDGVVVFQKKEPKE